VSPGKIFILFAIIIFLPFAFISCPEEEGKDKDKSKVKPATVNFYNESSYRVDVYKNLNPEHFDPSTLVCTINPATLKKVKQYPSYDQLIGDAFFPRYKILLENRLNTGTTDIYVDAQRVLTNLSFVIESGKTYTKTIPQPGNGELSFFHAYLKIQNNGSTQIQIIRGSNILSKLDNGSVWLNPGATGYYEIEFSYFDSSSINITQLKAFTTSDVLFPSFSVERGKKYSFTVQGSTISGPTVENIAIN
jgi:hypothetical protein